MKASFFEKYRLEAVVFLGGAVVMTIELVGSRVVAPYFGNSLIVWTSLIGVVLGCLSAGYYFGGKMADRTPRYETLSVLLLFAAALTGVTAFVKEPLLAFISSFFGFELRFATFAAALLLFGPVSFLLGIISPFSARLRLVNVENTGKVVGNLYALSTLGSIFGTFFAGFFFIPAFGNTDLLYGLSLVLLFISMLSVLKIRKSHMYLLFLIIVTFFLNQRLGIFKLESLSDVDSIYSRILIKSVRDKSNNELLKMTVDNWGSQSAINLSAPDELYVDYTKTFALADRINPRINKALMIGGGGYTVPRYLLSHSLISRLDVVEIDPKMTELARKYFFLKDDSRMTIHHLDARFFVKASKDKYDVVFLDAFSSLTPPVHLTTFEFMSELSSHLTGDGFLMVNLVAAIEGEGAGFFEAEVSTLRAVFPLVEAFALADRDPLKPQNIMVIGYKQSQPRARLDLPRKLPIGDLKSELVLTDDFAPVEYLTRSYYLN